MFMVEKRKTSLKMLNLLKFTFSINSQCRVFLNVETQQTN